MKTIGIFSDTFTASTGFAVVCTNLANNLSRDFRVIYFGRFGQDKEFAQQTSIPFDHYFEYVSCEGGVWDRELVVRILKHYDEIDYVFCEDDWFSVQGILGACQFWDKPFHLLTPIDSLPVNPMAFDTIFSGCDKVYMPNRSYEIFNGKTRRNFDSTDAVRKRQGDLLKAIHLPHGVDTRIFYPRKVDREEEFTFVWIGRIEERKAPGRALLAFEKICDKIDARLFMRTGWNTPLGRRIYNYIIKRNIPVTMDSTADIPHYQMGEIYNKGDVNLCTAKAGGFEMSILEAAATGLPTIVTDWTFMNENVVNGKSGFHVPIEGLCSPPPAHNPVAKDRMWGNIDIDKLAETMYYCYMNQREVKSMGRWAKDYVKEEYSWEKVAKTLGDEMGR